MNKVIKELLNNLLMRIKIIAWNINGLRSIIDKNNLYYLIDKEKPNIICFGETKLSCPIDDVKSKLKDKIKGYKYRYFSTCSVKKGYSGQLFFKKETKFCYLWFGII